MANQLPDRGFANQATCLPGHAIRALWRPSGLDYVRGIGLVLSRGCAVVAERSVAVGDHSADACALGALDEPLRLGMFRIIPSSTGPRVWVEASPMFS